MDDHKRAENAKDSSLKQFLQEIRKRVDPSSVIYNIDSFEQFQRETIACECKNHGSMSGAVKLHDELRRSSYVIFHQFLNSLHDNTPTSLLATQIAAFYVQELIKSGLRRNCTEAVQFCQFKQALGDDVLANIQPGQTFTPAKSAAGDSIPPVQVTSLDEGQLYIPGDENKNITQAHADPSCVGIQPRGAEQTDDTSVYENLPELQTMSIEDNTLQAWTPHDNDRSNTEQKEDNI